MGVGSMLITVFLTYYTFYFIKFFNKRERNAIQKENKDMNKLRKVPMKTLEDQKKFINIKYPKKPKFKWSWKMVPMFVWGVIKFITIISIWRWLISLTGWEVQLWHSILFVIIVPILINFLLEKFNLQKSDIRVFLK